MEPLLKIWEKLGNPLAGDKAELIDKIAIFGFADARRTDKLYQDAFDVAQALAKAGYIVVDGGGPGVMEAATRGAKAAGGKTIGVTFYPKDAVHFEGRDLNNQIDEEIKTDNYLERTVTLMKEGQVYVVFNGASGTMSEFAMAWGLARLYFGYHKPLILYGKFWKNIMKALQKNLMIRPEETKVYKIVDTPKGVIKAIKDFEREVKQGKHKHLVVSQEEGAFII